MKNTHLSGVYLVCKGSHLSPAHTFSPKQNTFVVFYESYLNIWFVLLPTVLTFTYFTLHSLQTVHFKKVLFTEWLVFTKFKTDDLCDCTEKKSCICIL